MVKFISILSVLFLVSCTITKRVHLPGYHIEWKKNYRTHDKDHQEFSHKVLKGRQTHLESIDELVAHELRELRIRDASEDSLMACFSTKNERRHQATIESEKGVIGNAITPERSQKPKRLVSKIPRKSFSRASSTVTYEGLRYAAYSLLIFGAFILFGCIFVYFGLWAVESLFYSLVYTGNGLIAGIFGFLLFLLILIVAFIAYALVRYVFGGFMGGIIAAGISIGAGLLCLLIS